MSDHQMTAIDVVGYLKLTLLQIQIY